MLDFFCLTATQNLVIVISIELREAGDMIPTSHARSLLSMPRKAPYMDPEGMREMESYVRVVDLADRRRACLHVHDDIGASGINLFRRDFK